MLQIKFTSQNFRTFMCGWCKKLHPSLLSQTYQCFIYTKFHQSLTFSWTDQAISHAPVFAQATGRSSHLIPLILNGISLVKTCPHFYLQKIVQLYFILALAYYKNFITIIISFLFVFSCLIISLDCTHLKNLCFIHFCVLFKHSVSCFVATESLLEKQKLKMFYSLRKCEIPFYSPSIYLRNGS